MEGQNTERCTAASRVMSCVFLVNLYLMSCAGALLRHVLLRHVLVRRIVCWCTAASRHVSCNVMCFFFFESVRRSDDGDKQSRTKIHVFFGDKTHVCCIAFLNRDTSSLSLILGIGVGTIRARF